jgi:hypothetical protein
MPDYRRTTRLCPFDQLQPELVTIIRAHLQAQNLGNPIDETLMCCETTIDKIGAAWYDGLIGDTSDTISYLALILTPQRLIWARSGDRTTATAASAPLSDLFVKVIRPRNTRDFGLQLNVRMAGTRGRVTGQLLMGSEPAAKTFCEEIGRVMQIPTKPRKGLWPQWLGRHTED